MTMTDSEIVRMRLLVKQVGILARENNILKDAFQRLFADATRCPIHGLFLKIGIESWDRTIGIPGIKNWWREYKCPRELCPFRTSRRMDE